MAETQISVDYVEFDGLVLIERDVAQVCGSICEVCVGCKIISFEEQSLVVVGFEDEIQVVADRGEVISREQNLYFDLGWLCETHWYDFDFTEYVGVLDGSQFEDTADILFHLFDRCSHFEGEAFPPVDFLEIVESSLEDSFFF